MEFPEAGRNSARKFLEYFLNRQQPPPTSPDEEWESPVSSNWSTVSEEEAEGECMDIARNLLCKRSVCHVTSYSSATVGTGVEREFVTFKKQIGGSCEKNGPMKPHSNPKTLQKLRIVNGGLFFPHDPNWGLKNRLNMNNTNISLYVICFSAYSWCSVAL